MRSIRQYLLSAFITLSLLINAQDKSFNFEHYGPEDGLNNTNVWAAKQGPDGLLYFATQNGVYYYDGYSFNKLKAKNLKSNFIRNINFDSKELLIVNRETGIYSINNSNATATKSNYTFTNKVDELIIAGDYAYSLSDQIEVGIYNIKTKQVYKDELKSYDNQAFCIYKSKEGRVYIGRSTGLYWFNGEKQEKVKELKNHPVYSISTDNKGNLALGSANKIIILNNNYKIEKEYFPKFKAAKTILLSGEKNINKLLIDKYNRFWFTTFPDNNLYFYDNNSVFDVFELLNISPTLINHLSKDKNENVWISTYNDGVYFIQNPFFNNFSLSNNKKTLTINEVVLKGNLVIAATNNGLYSFNSADYSVKALSNPDDVFGEPIYNISGLSSDFYYSKAIGFNSKTGTVSYNKQTLNFKPISSKYILLLNSKEALIAESGTIYKMNLGTEKITDTILSYPDYRIKISSMLVNNNKLYVGTSNGLTICELTKKQCYSDSLFDYAINHISLINNKIYIAHESGFTVYDDKKNYTQLGEIKLAAVKKIKQYNNLIWFATLNGLYLCDANFKPISEFNKSCGLLSNTINDIFFDNDNVCIGTNKGLSIARLNDLTSYKNRPEAVKVLKYEIDQQSFYSVPTKISLTAEQNNLAIYFSSPVFNKPNKQFFKYTDENGKEIQLENKQIQINSIKGGNHLVKISASLDNINWSEPIVIEIQKEISFKETGWIYIIISTGALIFIIVISYFWVKQVKKKAIKRLSDEQQINLLKHQAMNALLSPHFIFNSLTSIQNYINTNNSLMASEYLAKFSRLIRMIIEKASQSRITLRDEIARLNYYLDLEKERFKNKFDFIIEVDPSINIDEISIPNMIIQPHAENSIIHGILPKHEHGTLKIRFTKNNNDLIIIIEDDGIGLIKAKEHAKSSHKSLGTSTISNILELNSKLYNKKQSVKMEDKSLLNPNDHGTIITITLEL